MKRCSLCYWLCRVVPCILILISLTVLFAAKLFVEPECSIQGTQIYAHRGYPLHYQENTINAIREAVELGYGIEMDIMTSLNGTPYLFHDHNTARLTGLDSEFNKLTDYEIDNLEIQKVIDNIHVYPNTAKIPRLKDVLNEVCLREPGISLYFDIKGLTPEDTNLHQISKTINSSACNGGGVVATPYLNMIDPIKNHFPSLSFMFYIRPGSWPLAHTIDFTLYKTMFWVLIIGNMNNLDLHKSVFDVHLKAYKEQSFCLGIYGVKDTEVNNLPEGVYSFVTVDPSTHVISDDVYEKHIWFFWFLIMLYIPIGIFFIYEFIMWYYYEEDDELLEGEQCHEELDVESLKL